MYRKILFISINILQGLAIFGKTLILICFSFLSFLITYKTKPFLKKEMNMMEHYSNLSAFLTLVSGAFYVLEINDVIKALSFANVIIVNTCFGCIWFKSISTIAFEKYISKIEKCQPIIAITIRSLKQSLDKVRFSFNLIAYLKSLAKYYFEMKSILLKEFLNHKQTKRILSIKFDNKIFPNKLEKRYEKRLMPIVRKKENTSELNPAFVNC